jgi:hypothetical protein
MKVSKNNFFIQVDSQFAYPKIGGETFYVDTDYNPRRLSTVIGKIHSLPICVTDQYKYELKLNEGDTVIFNRLVTQTKNKVFDNVFRSQYPQIYAKIQGETLTPLEDVLFCQPIIESDYKVGEIEVKGQVSKVCAFVKCLSKGASDVGIRKWDIVYFTKDADYEMDINGTLLYKMHIRSIIGIERDGELKTFGKKLLVKNITELGKVGDIQKIYAQHSMQTGVVVESGNTGIEKGTELTYFNGTASIVKYKDEWFAFIGEENIKYLKQWN